MTVERESSDIEGFGIVLLEAHSCGTAVIAGNSGGTKETLLTNKTGLIIDGESKKDLTEGVLKLLRNEKLLTDMGISARSHVEEKFSWSVLAKKAQVIFNHA